MCILPQLTNPKKKKRDPKKSDSWAPKTVTRVSMAAFCVRAQTRNFPNAPPHEWSNTQGLQLEIHVAKKRNQLLPMNHVPGALIIKCGGKECLLLFISSSKIGKTHLHFWWDQERVSQGGKRLQRGTGGFQGTTTVLFLQHVHFVIVHQAVCLGLVHFLCYTLDLNIYVNTYSLFNALNWVQVLIFIFPKGSLGSLVTQEYCSDHEFHGAGDLDSRKLKLSENRMPGWAEGSRHGGLPTSGAWPRGAQVQGGGPKSKGWKAWENGVLSNGP